MLSPAATPVRSPFAVTGIIISMAMNALSNGLMLAYLPLRLAEAGFEPWVAGAALTAMSAGGVAGCFIFGHIIRRVGPARAFAAGAAMVLLSILPIATFVDATLWILARGLYGFAVVGLFIVSQSWLNHAAENAWRGRVIAIFYMTYVVSLGLGAFVLRLLPLDGNSVPLAAMFFSTLCILPASLTRLPPPPAPETIAVAPLKVWRVSPVALIGLLAVGGLTMLVSGFAPIYATARGLGKDDVALLMFLMQFGMIVVQYPLGALSDRIDRRYVLLLSCLIVITCASYAWNYPSVGLMTLILVFAIWSGATETIFAVANAHANDRADPEFYVALSSTLLIAWSISGVVLPAIATALSPIYGPVVFMPLAIAIASLYFLFVVYRLVMSEGVAPADAEPYQPISAQAPLTPDLAPQAGVHDEVVDYQPR